jgi:hypothetical protein
MRPDVSFHGFANGGGTNACSAARYRALEATRPSDNIEFQLTWLCTESLLVEAAPRKRGDRIRIISACASDYPHGATPARVLYSFDVLSTFLSHCSRP